jgi:hypothetical protein
MIAHIDSIDLPVDPQRGSQSTGTTGQVPQPGGASIALHLIEAFQWFERADEHAPSHTADLAADVEHEMIAVGEVDVCMTAPQEQRAIAESRAPKMMGGGIAGGIGFGLHHAPNHPTLGRFANDDFTD